MMAKEKAKCLVKLQDRIDEVKAQGTSTMDVSKPEVVTVEKDKPLQDCEWELLD